MSRLSGRPSYFLGLMSLYCGPRCGLRGACGAGKSLLNWLRRSFNPSNGLRGPPWCPNGPPMCVFLVSHVPCLPGTDLPSQTAPILPGPRSNGLTLKGSTPWPPCASCAWSWWCAIFRKKRLTYCYYTLKKIVYVQILLILLKWYHISVQMFIQKTQNNWVLNKHIRYNRVKKSTIVQMEWIFLYHKFMC